MGGLIWIISALVGSDILKSFLPPKDWADVYGFIEKFTLALCLIGFIMAIGISIPAVLRNWWENKTKHLQIVFKYFIIYAGFMILVVGILVAIFILLEKMGGINPSIITNLARDTNSNDTITQLKVILKKSIPHFALSLFTMCILAPVIEEIFFRRFLFVALRKKMNFAISLFISSISFMAVHPNMALGAIGGIYLGYVYEKGKSLPANILIHSAVNLATITISMVIM